MHVAAFFHRFGPYHQARLDAAGQRMQLTGIEVAGHTEDYAWDAVEGATSFERITLFPEQESASVSRQGLTSAIHAALSTLKPSVVAIHGWSIPSALSATRWCLQTETPSVIMSESTAHDESRTWWREAVKQRIVSLHQSGLVGGSLHEKYLSDLGCPSERIFQGYDVVDNRHFAEGAQEARSWSREVQTERGIPERYFLASARFIPKKNLFRLLQSYAEYRSRSKKVPWDLVLLGDGPLWNDIVQHRQALRLESSVHLPGFKQYDALPCYYGRADAFVHASTTEQWGLVVNEAMAAGLPVLVSNRCGCSADLVDPGINGFTFDPCDVDTLAAQMHHLASDRCDRSALGAASQRIIEDWSPSAFGKGLYRACRSALIEGCPSRSHIISTLTNDLLLRALLLR